MTTTVDPPLDMKARPDVLGARLYTPKIFIVVCIYMYVYNHHCLMLNIYIYTYDHAPRHAPRQENAPRYIGSPSLNPQHILCRIYIYICICMYTITTV